MSAPDTNVKTQEKKHKPSLLGIKGVLVFAGVLLIGFLVWTFAQSDEDTPTSDAGAATATE
ncbi:hypothetical protein ACOXXX_16830 [Thalassococcus sp. BH17M4-6]|uniref:hypothetical protein n=1 Tax=Thalassococcus sp. BH17M4-6 TaxID=3413148 RepID=UPI003BDB3671